MGMTYSSASEGHLSDLTPAIGIYAGRSAKAWGARSPPSRWLFLEVFSHGETKPSGGCVARSGKRRNVCVEGLRQLDCAALMAVCSGSPMEFCAREHSERELVS